MKIFFVADHNEDGDNVDLFVIANTPTEVESVWQDYYNRPDEFPRFIYRIVAASPNGFHEHPRAIEWHGINLPRVGGCAPANPR